MNFKNKLDQIDTKIIKTVSDYSKNTILDNIKHRYVLTMHISLADQIVQANKFIEKYYANFSKLPKNSDVCIINSQFTTKLDNNTFMNVNAGKINIFDKDSYGYSDRVGYRDATLVINIIGRNNKKYFDELVKYIQNRAMDNRLYLYKVSGSQRGMGELGLSSVYSEYKPRSFDSLFFSNDENVIIKNHVDTFLSNKTLFESRSLLYKTGLLLYGEPGTGKSSLAKAIASHYTMDMVLIDMNTFDYLDTNLLTDSINADSSRSYLILLEDIDTLFTMKREDAKIDEKKVINRLLQFLDSNSSPNNVVFVATTNHKELLDEALLRRFDKQIEIRALNKESAIEMCESFECLNKDQISNILSETISSDINMNKWRSSDNTLYNQSILQSKILSELAKGVMNNAEINLQQTE